MLSIFFVSILAYSKAYRAKNRIVEVIEKYGSYNDNASDEISATLFDMGYQTGECKYDSLSKGNGYKYCVEQKNAKEVYYYKVTTYVQFYFPIINELISPAVQSETKILGRSYDYE